MPFCDPQIIHRGHLAREEHLFRRGPLAVGARQQIAPREFLRRRAPGRAQGTEARTWSAAPARPILLAQHLQKLVCAIIPYGITELACECAFPQFPISRISAKGRKLIFQPIAPPNGTVQFADVGI